MKPKILIAISTVLLIVLLSCTNSARYKPQPADTTKTLAAYVRDSIPTVDFIYRVTKDTANLSAEPIVRGRDTTYYVPVTLPMLDSAGKVMLDQSGKPINMLTYVPTKRAAVIRDFNVNVDSLLKVKR